MKRVVTRRQRQQMRTDWTLRLLAAGNLLGFGFVMGEALAVIAR